jgi:4-hydroxy-tetrahydrodipicolinate synthase
VRAALDLEGFQRAVAFMAKAGAQGVTITGVLGESNRMTDAEREALIRIAVDTAAGCSSGDEPFRVCVGTSHAGTAATAALSQMAQGLGAHAVMVTPTKEPSPVSDDMMVGLYSRVAEACPGLPIVLQDHPASTQVHMSVPLLARIVKEVPSVACIKLESLPTPARIATLRQLWEQEPPESCTILTGLGALYGGFDLEQGTEGFMTGFAFPEILQAMNDAAQAGDFERAHALYARFLPLLVFEQQPGVAVRKELYRLRGLIECGHVRHPAMPAVSPALATALQAQLRRSLPGVDITKPLPSELFV